MWKVMAADDEAYMRNALAHMIPWQENGCALAGIYENGRRLIDAMEEGHPDIIVTDIRMPEMDGIQTLSRIREHHNMPVIFLTASDEETSIIMGLDIGGDDYITKPFKLGVLISRINALLRRANSFQAEDTELRSNGISVLLLQGRAFKNGKPSGSSRCTRF